MRRYIGMAAGLGLVVAALSAAGALTAAAQGSAKTVLSLIVNDATQPVPVTGTFSGSVNATVTEPVTLAPGQTVSLPPGTTINIGNASDNPVLVRDLNSARQPVRVFGFCQFSGINCHKDLYTVPGGFHLVLEHLSLFGQLFSPQEFNDIRLQRGILGPDTVFGDAPFEFFMPQPVFSTPGILSVRDTHQTLMFFNAGEIVRLAASRTVDGFGGHVTVNFAGYLVAN